MADDRAQGVAFDNERYLAEQSEAILERMRQVGGKLYLEFGGKLLFDYHASRVLPGFDPNVKMRLLQQLAEPDRDHPLRLRRRHRAPQGAGRLRHHLRRRHLQADRRPARARARGPGGGHHPVSTTSPPPRHSRNKLERRGIRVYTHRPIPGYPADVARVVSDEGYGANPYIETDAPLVVVNAPGPNSGKMGTCLSQVYHEHQRGVRPATPSSRPSRSGICRCATRSTPPTRPPPPSCATST